MDKAKIEWTPEQKQAITLRGKDMLVSASAGSGKTTVMIKRVLSLLEEGFDLKDMLIVTFTVAAAADMKEKLSKQLSASTSPKLKQQLNLLADADICTLHGWCKKLIGEYFYQIGIDPEFSVAEDSDRAAMLSKAVDKAIKEEAENPNIDFFQLCEIFGDSQDDKRLKELVILAFNNSVISIENTDKNSVISHDEYRQMLSNALKCRQNELLGRVRDLQVRTYAAKFTRNMVAVDALIQSVENICPTGKAPSTKVEPQFFDLNEEYKFLKEKANKLYERHIEIEESKPQTEKYLAVLEKLQQRTKQIFLDLKHEKGILDFNDMEHCALMLLQSDAGEEIRSRYKFIFVDEYQDINPLQDGLITALHQNNQLFLVGDLKQSIYAFRGCEPSIFAQKFKRFASDKNCAVIELNANHRSCDGILDYANQVFGKAMTEDFGGTDYLKHGMFSLGKRDGDGVRIHLCPDQSKDKKDSQEVYDLTKHRPQKNHMATSAAMAIANILAHKTVEENGKTRPALKKDIAVLMRSLNVDAAAALASRLAELNIKTNFIGAQNADIESKTLVSYLKLIDNRFDDEALINSMRGFFGGFSDSQLAKIAHKTQKEFFHQAVEEFCKNDTTDTELKDKVVDFFNRLQEYKKLSYILPACELAGKIVSDYNYFLYVFTKGEAAADALNAFLFDISTKKNQSLGALLSELNPSSDKSGCVSADAVIFMTVHQSKGLEFPFVILLNAEKQFNLKDLNQPVLIYKNNAAIKHYDWDTNTVYKSSAWLYNRDSLKKRQLEEELRLLYVAITRAKYSLDIFAACDSLLQCDKDPMDTIRWTDWLIQKNTTLDIVELDEDPDAKPKKIFAPFDNALVQKIKERFDFLVESSDAPPKAYVTRVLQENQQDHQPFIKIQRQDDLEESGLSAAQTGTLYHSAMEMIDFFADFDAQWQNLDKEIIENTNKQKVFCAVQKMKELCKGKSYYKEQGFMLKILAKEINLGNKEEVLLQGVIDLLILDGDECMIVDYKTGQYKKDYQKQLYYYALAAERILKKRVTKKLVYLFDKDLVLDI